MLTTHEAALIADLFTTKKDYPFGYIQKRSDSFWVILYADNQYLS